jgi:DNA-binding NtrC family response regulator
MSETGPVPHILVVDDDAEVRYSLNRVLSARPYRVQEAPSGEEGVAAVKKQPPDVVLLDNRMTGMTGLETLQHIRAANPKQLVILMTAFGTAQTAIEAMKFGAFDYVVKPFDPPTLLALIEAALRTQADIRSAGGVQPVLNSEEHKEGIVGTSAAMQQVFKVIGQVAASDVTVMITGESGTGKELIAREPAPADQPPQRDGPFVAGAHCSAIPREPDRERALRPRARRASPVPTAQPARASLTPRATAGPFSSTRSATMDLAGHADKDPARAAGRFEIQRVGGRHETLRVNVRIIAATNKRPRGRPGEATGHLPRGPLLPAQCRHVYVLPPLRERAEDIPQIVDFFIQSLAKGKKTKARKVSPEALAILCRHNWPGNVRELENMIYRSAVIARSDTILPKDLPDEVRGGAIAESATLELLYDQLYAQLKTTHPDDMLDAVKAALEAREGAGPDASAEVTAAKAKKPPAKKK